MAEEVRDLEVSLRVDTNKRTLVYRTEVGSIDEAIDYLTKLRDEGEGLI